MSKQNVIKNHIFKNCMLLLFAGALILSTPLSIAMNLQEQKYKKIDEFRQAYFYMKKSYSKNKNKDLRLDNAKYFSELLKN